MEKIAGSDLVRDDEVFLRMNLVERIQHIILLAAFFTLMLTGFPLMFYEMKLFKAIFSAEKSFYIRGVIHRVAAVTLIVNVSWHLGYAFFTRRGRANLKEMRPGFRDLRDAFEQFWYNLGLTQFLYRRRILKSFFEAHPYWLFKKAPDYGRYSFIEKFDYWASVLGSFVMIISGFFMWNVELSLSLFPLWAHNIFFIVHGYEAMLAFLAVIIWHMYNVHFNPEVFPMSKIWLNGKITGKELRLLHPLEYLRIVEEREKLKEKNSGTDHSV